MAKIDQELKKKVVQRNNDYHAVFSSVEGKRVLQDMMTSHYVLSTTHVPNDIVATSHNEGERNCVLRILSILKVTPVKMQRMMEEADRE